MKEGLGDDLGVVSAVYLVVLLPWGFLYFHDFISSRWLTIGETHRNGWIHIITISVPMPVVIFYIVTQQRLEEPDYKEMYAAITALSLSVFHLMRSIWGLHQLAQFRKWAIATTVTMKRAAYACPNISPETPAFSQERIRRSSSSFVQRRIHPDVAAPSSASRRFFDGFQRYPFTRNPSKLSLPLPLTQNLPVVPMVQMRCPVHTDGDCLASIDMEYIGEQVNQMLVNSTIIDNEFIGSSAPRLSLLSMKPYRTHETFVRWATCYLAQFGKDWLIDSRMHCYDDNSWEGRRYNLAADVWATAALRMETDCGFNKSVDPVTRMTGNKEQTSFLAPNLWSKFTPSPKDQIFAKKTLLEKCYRSPHGFPYNSPILQSHEKKLSAGVYKSLIKDALSELPSHLFDIVDNLQPEQLEWFAIFIWIGKWNGCSAEETPSMMTDHSPGVATRVTPAVRKTSLKPSHAPVRTLQDQLGLDEDLMLNKCTFPFVRQGFGRYLWRNRSVLQVSARIDNWLALTIGHQFAKLFRRNTAFGTDSEDFKSAHAFNTSNSPRSTPEPTEEVTDLPLRRTDRIFNYHKQLEITRLRYQLTRVGVPFRHLDQGITFMGCAMETLRSFLAEHLELGRQQSSDDESDEPMDNAWTIPLPLDTVVSFNISSQLIDCLKAVAKDESRDGDRFDSTVQERLLWECQNGIVKVLDEKLTMQRVDWENDRGPQRFAQSIILAILAFPALRIEYNRPDKNHNVSDMLTFTLSALASPQPLAIVIETSVPKARVHLRIVNESGEDEQFRWQDWRDAFHGRLFGKAEWQRSHYMRDLRVNHTRGDIGMPWKNVPVGENRVIPLWEGWQPFRARIRKYELEHSSLIIVGDDMPMDNLSTPQGSSGDLGLEAATSELPPRASTAGRIGGTSAGMLAYNQASPAALSDASAHVDSILRLNSSLFDKNERKKLTEPLSDDEYMTRPLSSPRMSPDSSNDAIPPVRMLWNKSIEEDLIDRVNEQDAEAMHTLAKHLLAGRRPFRKDKARALLLLERAITIGRAMKTVRRFVKTLLETEPVSDEAVDRALSAVERIWRDMPARHKAVGSRGHRRREWRNNEDGAEDERMRKLVALHLKVVNTRRQAELMRDLGDRLAAWRKSTDDESMAIVLYESAIIADCDVWAMVGLALLYVNHDTIFAKRLYERASSENWNGEDEHGWRRQEVISYVSRLARNGDLRATKLIQLQ